MITGGLVASAHDCSDGGLAVALAESCITGNGEAIGATVSITDPAIRVDQLLFGEDQSRVIVSCKPSNVEKASAVARKHGISAEEIGATGGSRLKIGGVVDLALIDLGEEYFGAIGRQMKEPT
jgi:phosphoribosylformylglycinamidine synthase